jgi:hypothetical protein
MYLPTRTVFERWAGPLAPAMATLGAVVGFILF